MPKYGTLEWVQQKQKIWNENAEIRRLLRGYYSTLVTKMAGSPELKPIFTKIEDGRQTEVRYAEPSDKPEYTYEATMEVWKAIWLGELDPMKAVVSGKLKLAGPLEKMMNYTKGFMKGLELEKKVPTEW